MATVSVEKRLVRALAGVAGQATALRSRAEALQREDRALRARVGRAP